MSAPLVRAAVYSRISHDAAGLALGVERQEQDCFRFIADRGMVAVRVYRENDASASSMARKPRPVYEEMLGDAEAGEFEVLVTYSTSRLTRRPSEFERLIALSEDVGLRIETIAAGPVNLGTADGRALARLLAAMDAAEAERLSERTRRALVQRAEDGMWCGTPPFGYQRGKRGGQPLVVHADNAALLLEASQRFLAGEIHGSICRSWSARGLRTTEGHAWYPTAITSMLSSPGPAGLLVVNGVLTEGRWQALISRAQWEAATDLLDDPSRHKRRHNKEHPHPLAGLLRCGECSRVMTRKTGPNKDFFHCGSTECHAKRQIDTRHLEHYLFDRIAYRAGGRRALPTAGTREMELRLATFGERRTALEDRYYSGSVDRGFFEAQAEELRGVMTGLRNALVVDARSRDLEDQAEAPPLDADDSIRAQWLREAITSVSILPHPAGPTQPPKEWAEHARRMSVRVAINWVDARSGD